MDPTIPMQARTGRPPGTTQGQFVERGEGDVVLIDRAGNKYPLDMVSILTGSFGFTDEGVSKLPRAAKYDSKGREVRRGDRVIIMFLEGSRKRPVVIGGAKAIDRNDFLAYSHRKPAGADQNRLAARLQPLDDEDNPVGSVDLEAAYDDKAALRVSVGPPDGAGPRTYAALDDDEGTAQVGLKDGTTLRLAPGQAALVTAAGHLLVLDADNGVQVAASSGGTADPMLELKEGTAKLLATLTQLIGAVEINDGATPSIYSLALAGTTGVGFYTDLSLALAELAALQAGAPGSVPLTTQLVADLTAAVAAPASVPGFVSRTGKSS